MNIIWLIVLFSIEINALRAFNIKTNEGELIFKHVIVFNKLDLVIKSYWT